jgi:hypothetical protein
MVVVMVGYSRIEEERELFGVNYSRDMEYDEGLFIMMSG